MTLVLGVPFTDSFTPFGIVREESVGPVGRVVNLGKTQAVGKTDCLSIYFGTTYNINIFLLRAVLESFVK